MMNWRNVVCVLAAGLLCTGALMAGEKTPPAPATTAGIGSSHATIAGQNASATPIAVRMPVQPTLSPIPAVAKAGHPGSADRLCAGTVYFSNLASYSGYYGPLGAGVGGADDCVATNDFSLVCYTFADYSPSAQDITVQLYTSCPYDGSGTLIAGTTSVTSVAAGDFGQHDVVLGSPVAMPASFWVEMIFSGDGGPLLYGPASVGTDNNIFGIQNQGCNYWYGGTPYAGYGFAAYGPDVAAACCVGSTCVGDIFQADCFAQGGLWFAGQLCANNPCPQAPPNDECVNVTPVALPANTFVTFFGDNSGATFGNDCLAFGSYPNVWEAFTTTECLNINLDYCGTAPAFGNAWLNLAQQCDPNCTFTVGGAYDFSTCGDGNVTIKWTGMPAATYWYPVLMDPLNGAVGPYIINVFGVPCPPPPPNDNCVDVTPVPLVPGTPLQFTGDNSGATADCALLGWPGEAWIAFSTTESLDVTVDLCGTAPAFATAGIVLSDCPCTVLTFSNGYDFTTCGDNNITVFFNGLPSGNWWYPIYTAAGSMGPYVLNVNAVVPPLGACCVAGNCVGDMIQSDCTAQGGLWFIGETCANYVCPAVPWNDECVNVPPVALVPGTPLQFTGDNSGATLGNDCLAFGSYPNVWLAFTSTEALNITLDYCGSTGVWLNAWLNLALQCDPNCSFSGAASFSFSCPDGNLIMNWSYMVAGTYWYPIMLDPLNGSIGQYVININATSFGQGYCPAGALVCDEYITRVQLADVDNSTGCGLGSGGQVGYSDYTGTVAHLTNGTSYTITVTNGNPIWSPDTCGMWIDWGDDFSFAEPGDLINDPSAMGVGPYSTTFTPTVNGDHRLRIRIDYAETSQPCGVPTYGEVEDYTVNVSGGAFPRGDANCSGAVDAFDIDPFVLGLTNFDSWETTYPGCDWHTALDCNCDNEHNAFDIDPFVQCLTVGCPCK